jgi:hypothetical protein
MKRFFNFNSIQSKSIKPSFELKQFDIKSLEPHKNILIIGKNKSGKTTLVNNYLYHNISKFKTVSLISSDDNKHIEPQHIYNIHSIQLIDYLIGCQQKIITKNFEDKVNSPTLINFNKNIIILDDSKNCIQYSYVNYLIKNVFNVLNITIILSVNKNNVPLNILDCIQYVFLFKNANIKQQRKIYKIYANRFKSFAQFQEIFLYYTQNYGCLVINVESPILFSDNNIEIENGNGNGNGTEIENNIFYYKVNENPEWEYV